MPATMDTHREVKKLVGAGLAEPQAEAVVSTVVEGREGLATKADLDLMGTALRADMDQLHITLTADMDQLRTTLTADMDQLRTTLTADMNQLRTTLRGDMKDLKLDLIKWLGGTMIATVGIAVAVLSLILGG